MIKCANPKCSNTFTQVKHNQKYCTPECCKIVTNQELMRQYYQRKARLAGEVRYCDTCETTKLSRYNDGMTCAPCLAKQETEVRSKLLKALGI